MSTLGDIKSEIKSVIVSGVSKVQEVETYDKQPANGFPLVTITMSENENDFYSTANNMRVYIIRISVYEQMAVNVNNPTVSTWNSACERAEHNLVDVVNDILDILDKKYTLNDKVDFVEAAPSAWGYAQLETGWCRTADILLRVHKQFDVTA